MKGVRRNLVAEYAKDRPGGGEHQGEGAERFSRELPAHSLAYGFTA
jgi:hypothetical protein